MQPRISQKSIRAEVPEHSILVPWQIDASRPHLATLDGDAPDFQLRGLSTDYRRRVTLRVNGIVPDREGVDRVVTVTHSFTRDEFAEFLQQLTDINAWILEPFEIPTTEEKN